MVTVAADLVLSQHWRAHSPEVVMMKVMTRYYDYYYLFVVVVIDAVLTMESW